MGLGSIAGAVGGGALGFALGGPVGAGVGLAGGSLIGGYLDGDFSKPGAVGAPQIGPNAVTYGRDPSYYTDTRNEWADERRGAQNQAAPEVDLGMANDDYARQLSARQGQQSMADEYRMVLSGQKASLAQLQMQRAQQMNAQNAATLAASARGGGGNQILAMREAQRQGALMGQQAAADTAMLRAREEAEARGALAGLYGQMRQGDMAARAGSMQQGFGLADVEARQRALNAQREGMYLQGELGLNQGDAAARAGLAQANQSAQVAAMQINAANEQAARQQSTAITGSLIGAGGTVAGYGLANSQQPKPGGGGYGPNDPGF